MPELGTIPIHQSFNRNWTVGLTMPMKQLKNLLDIPLPEQSSRHMPDIRKFHPLAPNLTFPFRYSGQTAAHAYKYLRVSDANLKRVFILGPSHHHYLDRCALTSFRTYHTPIGDLSVDADGSFQKLALHVTKVNAALMKTGKFEKMSCSVDEEEHSIEMHLPYLAHLLAG